MSQALSPVKQALLQALRRGERVVAASQPFFERRPEGTRAPLSLQQERIWEVESKTPHLSTYMNLYMVARFIGPLDLGLLKRSFDELARRQENFRMRIATDGGVPAPVVAPSIEYDIPVTEVRGATLETAEREACSLADLEGAKRYDVRNGPLTRLHLYRINPERHLLLLGVHHIVFDAWSGGLVLFELASHYSAFKRGEPPSLPELAFQYADYAYWQRLWSATPEVRAQEEFWRRHLAGGVPVATLPGAKGRPCEVEPDGAFVRIALDDALAERVRALSRDLNAPPFVALVSAFAVLLSKLTGQSTILVCVPITGRHFANLERIVGYFANALPLRFEIEPTLTFDEIIRRTRATSFAAYAHQDIQMERFAELAPEGRLPWQFLMQLQHLPAPSFSIDGIELESAGVSYGRERLDLSIDLIETQALTGAGDRMVGFLNYNRNLYDEDTIVGFWREYQCLLGRATEQPKRRLAEL